MPTSTTSAASSHHGRGIGLMLASAVFFIANVLLIRALAEIEQVNLWLVGCARFLVGLIIILALYRREFQPSHLFRRRKLAERGLIGGIGVYGYYFTVLHLGAGRATFINNTYVVWGALMAVVMLGEKLRPNLMIGSVAALAGLGLLTGAWAGASAVSWYDLVAIIVALGSAYIVVTIRQLHSTEHTSTIFAAQCVYGLLICGVPAIVQFESMSNLAWSLLLIASASAGFGQIAMTRAFRDLSVAEGSLLQMVVPLGIALGGIVFFGERFRPDEVVGAALILVGTALPAFKR